MLLSASTLIALLFALLASGVIVPFALAASGIIALEVFTSLPVERIVAVAIWDAVTAPELLALALFILMAEILLRANVARMLFEGLIPVTRLLPGGLLHVNVIGSTIFASICGSSAATAATIGKISIPELKALGYSPRWIVGSLASAATLGLIIPPSIILIIYGVLMQASITKLFIAGILPGLLLALMFSLILAIFARNQKVNASEPTSQAQPDTNGLRSFLRIVPVLLLAATIIVSLYGGYASPTEAALVGVLGAILLTIFLTRRIMPLIDGFYAAVRTISMLGLIIAGAKILTSAFAYLGISREVTRFIIESGVSQTGFLLAVLVLLIVLGCIMDGLSMMVMTLPLLAPAITALDINVLWFGIFLVVIVEIGQITPPVGMNIFVIRGISNESIYDICVGVLPFFLCMLGFACLIIAVPQIVLFLPEAMR